MRVRGWNMRRLSKEKEWKTIRSVGLDHPYFDCPEHRWTEREAEEVMAKNVLPDAKETFYRTYSEYISGASVSECAGRAQRRIRRSPRGVPGRRLLACAIGILAVISLAVVAERVGWGQSTVAERSRNYEVSYYDNRIYVRNPVPHYDLPEIKVDASRGEITTIRELADVTGRRVVVTKEEERCVNTIIETEASFAFCIREYLGEDGTQYSVSQNFLQNGIFSSTSYEHTNGPVEPVELPIGASAYLSMDEAGNAMIHAYGDDAQITIMGEGLTSEMAWEIAFDLTWIEPNEYKG